MSLDILKFVIPLIAAYSVFAAISGQLNPFSVPESDKLQRKRARGIAAGIAITIVLTIASGAINNSQLFSTISPLTAAIALLVAIVAMSAIAVYELIRYRSSHKAKRESASFLDQNFADSQLDANETAPQSCDVSPAYLTKVQIEQLDYDARADAINDAHTSENTMLHARASAGGAISSHASKQTEKRLGAYIPLDADNIKLSTKLAAEKALREQTEKHLRITRKALSNLEAETRENSVVNVETLQVVEEKLADSIATASDLESKILNEKNKRLEAEQRLIEMKQKIMRARQKLKRSSAARARALSTANKSVAFAKQSIQIRGRLESDLETATTKIDSHKQTIHNLLRALEKEKRRNKEEIKSAAKQLVLKERQLVAKRSLEDTARNVENNLASRLTKKVAKARPATPSDEVQGKS